MKAVKHDSRNYHQLIVLPVFRELELLQQRHILDAADEIAATLQQFWNVEAVGQLANAIDVLC